MEPQKINFIRMLILISLISSIYAWSYSFSGNTYTIFGAPTPTNTNPQVAYYPKDRFVLAWTGSSSGADNIVNYGLYNSDGSMLQAGIQVDNGGGNNENAWVTVDNSGGFVVIWSRRASGSGVAACVNNLDVFARYYDSTLTPGTITKVNPLNPSFCSTAYYPSVIYTGTSFVGCYASVVVKFSNTPTINVLASRSIEKTGTKQFDDYCVLTSLGNGTIAASYVTSYSGSSSQVFYAILKESDLSVILSSTQVSTTFTQQKSPSIALLPTSTPVKFVIVWGESDQNIFAQLFDLNGAAVNLSFQVNTTTPSCCASVKYVSLNGFAVTYTANNNVKFQTFGTDGVQNGTEVPIPGAGGGSSKINADPKLDKYFMIAYSNSMMSTVLTVYSDDVPCINFVFGIGTTDSSPMKIPFSKDFQDIYFQTQAVNGKVRDSVGYVGTTGFYDASDCKYEFTDKTLTDSFTYTTAPTDSPCTATIGPCYVACNSCSDIGNATDPKCITCNITGGYFPLSDDSTKCYNSKPTGYYSGTNVWNKCYASCQDCIQYPVDNTVDMKCTICAANYYPKEDSLSSNCFTGTVAGYYLDVNVYKKGQAAITTPTSGCYSICQTCNQPSSVSNPNCLTCIANYFPKEDNLTNCFNGIQPQYYLNNNIYKKCYSTCQTCNSLGTDSNHQCSTCISNYFPKSDNMSSCFTGDIPQYSFSEGIYQKCFYLCKTCILSGTPTNNQCSSCIDGYYPKEDYPNNCYTGQYPQYYLDNGIYKKCYPTCQECNITGDEVDHQCTTCVAKYYPKIDFATNCFTDIQAYYYLDDNNIYQKCYPTCLTCSSMGTEIDHKCLSCVNNYYPNVDNPTSCFTGQQDGYTLEGTMYQKCQNCSTTIKLINSCETSPCLNNGLCSIKLNKVNCECTAEFVGWLCQYNIETLSLEELIKVYYDTDTIQSIYDLIAVLSTHFPIDKDDLLNALYNYLSITFFNHSSSGYENYQY
jgi:hypothetical protein